VEDRIGFVLFGEQAQLRREGLDGQLEALEVLAGPARSNERFASVSQSCDGAGEGAFVGDGPKDGKHVRNAERDECHAGSRRKRAGNLPDVTAVHRGVVAVTVGEHRIGDVVNRPHQSAGPPVREFTTAIDSLAKMSVQPIQMSPIHIASVK